MIWCALVTPRWLNCHARVWSCNTAAGTIEDVNKPNVEVLDERRDAECRYSAREGGAPARAAGGAGDGRVRRADTARRARDGRRGGGHEGLQDRRRQGPRRRDRRQDQGRRREGAVLSAVRCSRPRVGVRTPAIRGSWFA